MQRLPPGTNVYDRNAWNIVVNFLRSSKQRKEPSNTRPRTEPVSEKPVEAVPKTNEIDYFARAFE